MASRTAQCNWCGTTFTGYGDTGNDAQADANTTAIMHAHECPSNPANKEDE